MLRVGVGVESCTVIFLERHFLFTCWDTFAVSENWTVLCCIRHGISSAAGASDSNSRHTAPPINVFDILTLSFCHNAQRYTDEQMTTMPIADHSENSFTRTCRGKTAVKRSLRIPVGLPELNWVYSRHKVYKTTCHSERTFDTSCRSCCPLGLHRYSWKVGFRRACPWDTYHHWNVHPCCRHSSTLLRL